MSMCGMTVEFCADVTGEKAVRSKLIDRMTRCVVRRFSRIQPWVTIVVPAIAEAQGPHIEVD
jgi:hypothetical protein